MFFTGRIEIDPAQMTVIKKVKPSKVFAKFLDALTFGKTSDKQEHETFTVVSILQQLNMALRSLKMKNVIRLAVDDYDFYYDEEGVDDDMHQAMLQMETKIDPIESERFDSIYLVLEHEDKVMKYVIEIQIERKHIVGEYAIKIFINGVLTDFQLKNGETREDLEKRMESVFSSQEKFDSYIKTKKEYFDRFVDNLASAVRKFIKIDDIKKIVRAQIVRPKEKIDNPANMKTETHSQPVFYGYHGFENYLYYTMIWSSMAYNNNMYMNDFTMVDQTGHEVMDVGPVGFNAGESNTLNENAGFEAPAAGDVTYHGENDFESDLQGANLYSDTGTADSFGDSDTSSWADSDGGGGDMASCSSCSSCSSCGGCGGCG